MSCFKNFILSNFVTGKRVNMKSTQCYHCGDFCDNNLIQFDKKPFCCNGCKTVYEIFCDNDLINYYKFQDNPGTTPKEVHGKYDFLENKEIVEKLLDFSDGNTQAVTLYIPNIHCSSCILVLENLHKLKYEISSSQVNFQKKTVRITYNSEDTSLKESVSLLNSIGYEPYISLENFESRKKTVNRSLIYKLGVAGFAFGNVMFLSFPEYFEVNGFWIEKYKNTFRWLMFLFSIPAVFYAGKDYFISAYKGLHSKILNIDIPIALGILVLFIRSFIEIIFDLGTGFFDSLTGLIFFLLLGKFFQQKTYNFLSFERDYKSYFPIAVTKITSEGKEENIQTYQVKKGDRLLIRNQELIPVDGILINGNGQIDYSFVTGESAIVTKKPGDKVFAGGKQSLGAIEIEVLTSISQSYLTQLWSNDVFKKDNISNFKTITDTISKNFTIAVLTIAFLATSFWLYYDSNKALNVFTSVLIIACPCAIALAAPFTLGNMLRIFGKQKFYIKNATIIEKLSKIDTLIFDKTGTLTTNEQSIVSYDGVPLNYQEKSVLKSSLRSSSHTLSRILYNSFNDIEIVEISNFKEILGKGIQANYKELNLKLGSSSFIKNNDSKSNLETSVHICFNEIYKGKFVFKNPYRKGMASLFDSLHDNYNLAVVSGDNEGEKNYLQKKLPKGTKFLFNQKPEDKLNLTANLQKENKKVAMIGDGLNDSGALAQSDVGIVLSENINVFSPACDAILDASKFSKIAIFIEASIKAIKIIKYSFILSLFYNVIGLYFAVTAELSPIIAAILMPLSSISIVIFTTITTNIIGRKIK